MPTCGGCGRTGTLPPPVGPLGLSIGMCAMAAVRHSMMLMSLSQLRISPADEATLLREVLKPSTMVASGYRPAMSAMVPDHPLPPCEENGMMVFPEKSYLSKNEYIGIGIWYHHIGYPTNTTS